MGYQAKSSGTDLGRQKMALIALSVYTRIYLTIETYTNHRDLNAH